MPTADPWRSIVGRLESKSAQKLNAITSYERDVVLAQAAAQDTVEPQVGVRGCSIGIKDNICTLEYQTTCGSRLLKGYNSPFEATAIKRIKSAGGIVSCKTNLDEFGMGSSTEHSAFGRTLNPVDHERVPGGSSGGSAALVAEGAVDVALGSETGGSVRQPAAFCGVVGVKPSYGRVSRYGLVAFGSSLDQIGVLAPTVDLASEVLAVISGRDPNDATCADLDPIQPREAPADFSALTVGIPAELPGRAGYGSDRRVSRGDCGYAIGRCHNPAGVAAAYVFGCTVLPHHSLGRGQLQSRSIRRCQVWQSIVGPVGRAPGGDVPSNAREWVRGGGPEADHGRYLRAFCRVLRCLLRQSRGDAPSNRS